MGHPLREHSSPFYIEVADKRIFRPEVARKLIAQMEQSIETIRAEAELAGKDERLAGFNADRMAPPLRKRLQTAKQHRGCRGC